MDGLHYLGADAGQGDYVGYLKKAGPSAVVGFEWKKAAGAALPMVASAAEDALKDKPKDGGTPAGTPGATPPKPQSGASGESWFTKPVLGPIPGGGVLAIGAGVLAIGGLVVKKIFF